jgi:signal transduction histidine kinase
MNERAFRAMEQEVLNQKIQEQKKITRAILNAQEKERNHIGQELHDNISQILASSKLFLCAAGDENEAVKELVKYPMELIDSSIHEIRRLSSRHVTPIKDVDLQELVQSLLDSLRENTSINTTFQYDVDNRELSDDLKLNIYRIIQEQINNIVKHAAPGEVDISVQAEENGLHIEIKDDGQGFDINKKRKGIGISNMMNRIESFNGQMLIDSSPGKGCSVHIDIPY